MILLSKHTRKYLLILLTISLIRCDAKYDYPRVIITTDINNAGGDPDDKQSLVHLLWYADELDIVGIIRIPVTVGKMLQKCMHIIKVPCLSEGKICMMS